MNQYLNHKPYYYVRKFTVLCLLMTFLITIGSCQKSKSSIVNYTSTPFQGSAWYYRFYPWSHQQQLETLYYQTKDTDQNLFPQQEESYIVGPVTKQDQNTTNQPEQSKNNKKSTPAKQVLEPPKQKKPGAIIHASLTSSPGAVAISGSRYLVSIDIDGKKMEEENFTTAAASGFTILAEGNGIKKTFQINSPSFGTNFIIQSLTLSINPITDMVSISGKLNLDLPGTMSGSLINLTSGASSSCEVKHGYFSTSVHLIQGNNQLTALGKWLTITLELPYISVLVQS